MEQGKRREMRFQIVRDERKLVIPEDESESSITETLISSSDSSFSSSSRIQEVPANRKSLSWRSSKKADSDGSIGPPPPPPATPLTPRRKKWEEVTKLAMFPLRKWSVENSTSQILQEGRKILDGMREALAEHKERAVPLNSGVKQHMKLAKTRYYTENYIGATVSLRKVKRLQSELKKVMIVIDFLQHQEIDLLTQMEEARELNELIERGDARAASRRTCLTLELSRFNEYALEVNNILGAESHAGSSVDDEAVLAELREMMAAEQK